MRAYILFPILIALKKDFDRATFVSLSMLSGIINQKTQKLKIVFTLMVAS
jgi:hypothetical protein